MDEIDHLIIYELQNSGRLSNQDLADRVGLSPTPCLRRVRILEQRGIIAGYTAVIDPKALGLGITAFVRLRLSSHGRDDVDHVEEMIRLVPNVVEAYLLAGDYDYLMKVVVGSLDEYEHLLKTRIRELPTIASIETTFAFGTTKTTSPLPVDHLSRATIPLH